MLKKWLVHMHWQLQMIHQFHLDLGDHLIVGCCHSLTSVLLIVTKSTYTYSFFNLVHASHSLIVMLSIVYNSSDFNKISIWFELVCRLHCFLGCCTRNFNWSS
jgi:hypothetical protein